MIGRLYILFFICGFVLSQRGNCTVRDRFGKVVYYFCCDNHEEINGSCVECLDGFESFDELPCTSCENGRYGRKCAEICRCLENEICHHQMGCIQVSSDISTFQGSSRLSTQIHLKTKSVRDSTIHRTVTIPNSSFGIGIPSSEKGLLKREIIVYSLGAAILVIVILLCTACQHRYKQLYNNLKKYQNDNRRRGIVPDDQLSEIPHGIGGIYEVIDETNMIGNRGQIDRNNTVSDINESHFQADNNGYLTPYQPATEDDAQNNSLNDSKSESLESADANHQSTGDSESTSSSSDVEDRRCTYLNPYQQIISLVDIHDYASTQNVDDSGSSGSDAMSGESGYLNTYQPTIEVRDFHEYQYIHGCSDKSNTCTK